MILSSSLYMDASLWQVFLYGHVLWMEVRALCVLVLAAVYAPELRADCTF